MAKKTASIGIRLSQGLKAALEVAAEDDHRGVASLIEKVMTEWLEANGYKVTEPTPHKRATRKRPAQLAMPLGGPS